MARPVFSQFLSLISVLVLISACSSSYNPSRQEHCLYNDCDVTLGGVPSERVKQHSLEKWGRVPIYIPDLEYPELHRKNGVEGGALLEYSIDPEGFVTDVVIVVSDSSGEDQGLIFEGFAVGHIKQYRYEPADQKTTNVQKILMWRLEP